MKNLDSLLRKAGWSNCLALIVFMGVLSAAWPLWADSCTVCNHVDRPGTGAKEGYTCLAMPQCDTTTDSFFCTRCSTVTEYTCTKEGAPDKVNRDYECGTGDGCGGVQTGFQCN